jgi:phospholipid transport system substrate-binding protein
MKYFAIFILLISNVALATGNKQKEGNPGIQEYVHKLMNASIQVLKNDQISSDEKTSKVRSMLSENMDTTWMGKFTLGRTIKTTPEDIISKFVLVYNKYVLTNYARAVSQYKGEKVEIQTVQGMDDNFSIVKTQVIKSDGNVINVNYLVHELPNSSYKVCDIITEGISLINSQRAEFTGVIASQGIDSLIEDLKQRM